MFVEAGMASVAACVEPVVTVVLSVDVVVLPSPQAVIHRRKKIDAGAKSFIFIKFNFRQLTLKKLFQLLIINGLILKILSIGSD
jgi:hypothetical protein